VLTHGWLTAQPPSFQALVLRKARLVTCPTGTAIIRIGDRAGGIYGVVQGGVGIHVPQIDGSVTLAHIARTGVWFGYGPLITRRPRVLEFSALEPSLLFHVPLAGLEPIMTASSENARALQALSEFNMDIAISTVATLQIRSAERRIAATLLRVAPEEDETGGQIVDVAVTQAQLGEMANAAREVVNRVLNEFEARAWLKVGYRKVALLDLPSLRSLVAGGA
jgi:CRP/FNR family transcriptional regulator, cyclic AMP receptor protein